MFELWDTDTHNIVGAFDSELSALLSINDVFQAHGEGYVDALALVFEDTAGKAQTVAIGMALVRLARSAAA